MKTAWESNITEVQKEANRLRSISLSHPDHKGWLKDKLINHTERCLPEKPIEEILDEISSSQLAASFFAKDPKKQNIAEKSQLEYLCSKLEKEITKSSSVYLMSDGSLERHTHHPPGATAKSIDFYHNDCNDGNNGVEEYYFAKVTERNGGAQDNQWADVRSFIDAAKKNIEKENEKKKFIAVVDGNYYWNEDGNPTRKCKQLISDTEGYDEYIRIVSCDNC